MNYCRKTPCNNCPYRIDAPLRHWSIQEFKDLLKNEATYFGTVYACHKKDGHVCVGWLMMQEKNNFPSIALRISLLHNKVDRKYLDSLKCKSELFETTREMCEENYPELN